jgi:hypothetical protein
MAITVNQMQTWLDEAIAAKQKLMTGDKVRRVQGPSGQVEFAQADLDRLDAWINQLRGWIANGGMPDAVSAGTHRPIRFVF